MRNTANTELYTANSELYTANSEKPGTMTKKNASSITNSHRKFVSLQPKLAKQSMRRLFIIGLTALALTSFVTSRQTSITSSDWMPTDCWLLT